MQRNTPPDPISEELTGLNSDIPPEDWDDESENDHE